MKKRQRPSASSLFLMELILAILLFCMAATICISVFARSHLMHKEAGELNMSVNVVQNIAEAIRSGDSIKDIDNTLNDIYSDYNLNIKSPVTFDIPLDNEMKIAETDNETVYILTVESENQDNLLCSVITLNKIIDNEDAQMQMPIYDLYVEHALKY